MARARLKSHQKKRMAGQAAAFLLANANLPGFFTGRIYQGPLKNLCLPGLNCYSCPGALGACPLGSLQNGLADPLWRIPYYVLGFLVLTGTFLGRFVCGWLCPFGWFQELWHKLPGKKYEPAEKASLHGWLLRLKTLLLILLVIVAPLVLRLLFTYGLPVFCTYVCPAGTFMAGIPLLLANSSLRALAGWLFSWKMSILLAVVLASVFIYRPFCRYLCPLGAIYGFFNRFSIYRLRVDEDLCIHCAACTRQCPMRVPVPYDGNGPECIRCGECASVCPTNAIKLGFWPEKKIREENYEH